MQGPKLVFKTPMFLRQDDDVVDPLKARGATTPIAATAIGTETAAPSQQNHENPQCSSKWHSKRVSSGSHQSSFVKAWRSFSFILLLIHSLVFLQKFSAKVGLG
jgi:hypothetical protein